MPSHRGAPVTQSPYADAPGTSQVTSASVPAGRVGEEASRCSSPHCGAPRLQVVLPRPKELTQPSALHLPDAEPPAPWPPTPGLEAGVWPWAAGRLPLRDRRSDPHPVLNGVFQAQDDKQPPPHVQTASSPRFSPCSPRKAPPSPGLLPHALQEGPGFHELAGPPRLCPGW